MGGPCLWQVGSREQCRVNGSSPPPAPASRWRPGSTHRAVSASLHTSLHPHVLLESATGSVVLSNSVCISTFLPASENFPLCCLSPHMIYKSSQRPTFVGERDRRAASPCCTMSNVRRHDSPDWSAVEAPDAPVPPPPAPHQYTCQHDTSRSPSQTLPERLQPESESQHGIAEHAGRKLTGIAIME